MTEPFTLTTETIREIVVWLMLLMIVAYGLITIFVRNKQKSEELCERILVTIGGFTLGPLLLVYCIFGDHKCNGYELIIPVLFTILFVNFIIHWFIQTFNAVKNNKRDS